MRRVAVALILAALMAAGEAVGQPCGSRSEWLCPLQAASAQIVLAQGDPDADPVPAPETGPPDWTGCPMPQAGQRHLEQLRMLKLLELLELSDEQEVTFISMFHRVQRDIRRIDDEKRALVAQLADGLGSGGSDERTIMQLVEQIHQKDRERLGRMDQFLTDARTVLSATQLGKLVIFHERFEAEMLKRLRGFHERGGRMGPGGPGGR